MIGAATRTLKWRAQSILRRLGYELVPFSPQESNAARRYRFLLKDRINLVLDVGANKGQYAQSLRHLGYRGTIVSFEPQSEAYQRLSLASRGDVSWIVAPRMAIGSRSGEIDIHIARNSSSSSVLPMTPTHLRAAPQSAYVGIERVQLSTLDLLAPDYLDAKSIVHLKIDTQGYEHEVLDGAQGVLKRITSLQLELSFTQLYTGQKLWPEMLSLLGSLGFCLWNMFPVLIDPDGRLLQVDALFARE